MTTNPWFPFGIRKDRSRPLLFCFHYAGGSSTIFRHWVALRSTVDIVPVELPGRGTRMAEPHPQRFDELIEALLAALAPEVEGREFCLFGHSMGAAIAFDAACRLEREYGFRTAKLIVAGRHAPHRPDPSPFSSDMDDEALVRELQRLGGTPPDILENEELLRYLLPMIRSDYRLHESFVYRRQLLMAPIVAHSGTGDRDASEEEMRHWSEVTDAEFAIRSFEGNHFFVQRLGDAYLNELLRLAAMPGNGSREAYYS